ncbi:MAG: S8 family serine peptidase [Cyanobacteria bacterium P01_A01_bin.123]
MRKIVPSLLLSGLMVGATSIALGPTNHLSLPEAMTTQAAQAQTNDEIYYTFYGQRIPLTLRQDQIAVLLTPPVGLRGGTSPYQQLEGALLGQPTVGVRGGEATEAAPALDVTVQPLGSRYAIIQLPGIDAELTAAVQERLQQPYVETTLPVLSRTDSENTIVLPNQIIVSFEPDTPQSQVQLTLNRYGLEMIRPIQFSQNRYLVSARSGAGLRVLTVANQLNGVAGIQSATPNFVQTLSYRTVPYSVDNLSAAALRNNLEEQLTQLSGDGDWPVDTDLFPLHWHLDSSSFRGTRQPRTDLRVAQAWEQGSQGEGVVVAVIDSLIQWDHPDLADNLYTVPETQPNRLPGEIHGWDFSNPEVTCTDDLELCVAGDADTRINNAEVDLLREDLQNTFTLSDAEILEIYEDIAWFIEFEQPEWSQREIANTVRDWIQGNIMAEFHGTWASGVVAANPASDRGAVGVAPETEILPVRVFGLNGEISVAALVEAIGYAADRGADVINLSLGGLLPDRELTDQVMAVLEANPDLVIVASAGNESLDGVGFPAAIPGVISVGATTLDGTRTFYSSYGGGLDVVAPGGDTTELSTFGILTTGGTWVPAFWEGIDQPSTAWGMGIDPLGSYVQVQGTSFSAPATAGVAALVLAANGDLDRAEVTEVLRTTASYEGLSLRQAEANQYRLQAEVGLGTAIDSQILRPTGIFGFPEPISPEQYYFGQGLVDAGAAVELAKTMR